MARRVYKTDLSVKGIDNLIKQLNDYKNSLNEKTALFVKRLAELGIPIIDQRIQESQGDSNKSHNTFITVTSNGDYSQAHLIVEGKDILFIEFGAGIYYNNGNINPKASELGYGVNTYNPDSDRAINPGYWWYGNKESGLHFSLGTEATMPMYKASLEIIGRIREIAQEVFGQ